MVYTQENFTLTIQYLYQNGAVAAPAYTDTLHFGDAYNVLSPTVDGYHTARRVVSGEMPARNVTLTVIYVADNDGPDLITIEDMEIPLGLGLGGTNAGETIE